MCGRGGGGGGGEEIVIGITEVYQEYMYILQRDTKIYKDIRRSVHTCHCTASCIAPRWTGMWGALATRPPSGPNSAQEKSSRSCCHGDITECNVTSHLKPESCMQYLTLMLVEMAVLCNTLEKWEHSSIQHVHTNCCAKLVCGQTLLRKTVRASQIILVTMSIIIVWTFSGETLSLRMN